MGGAALMATLALAGPRWGTRVVETRAKGLNLVLAMDVSRSMLAEDVAPSRLERAKREARRLIHDLDGDRLGLVSFAGQGFVLSPLTVDGSALHLLVDALHPDITTAGGSELAHALKRSHDLLLAGDEVADRVLVLFSDGEAHDSLASVLLEAERLRRSGIHLILVAEGGADPARIPVRDADGNFIGFQRDPSEQVVQTRRRDDILAAIADAARGVIVSAEVADQAGTVREMITAYKRSPTATTTAAQDVSRAWMFSLVAALTLLLHTATRRTAALVSVALCVAGLAPAHAQSPRNRADHAWMEGDFERAVALYSEQAEAGAGGDTVMFNLGTAAMVAGDTAVARRALQLAARSLEPEVRFRAQYNLGYLELRLAERDTEREVEHLSEALNHYRAALLLRPYDADTKWNYELAMRRMPPEQAEGSGSAAGGGDATSDAQAEQGLTAAQAVQILNSIAEEERLTRQRLNRTRAQVRETRGRRDW
jgi:Ca-activated chloride channel family protein